MKQSAFDNFSESAQEALDFARCQRADGSYYGTGGVCRKGTQAGAKEKTTSSKSKEAANVSRSQKQKQNASRTAALKEELDKRKGEMKGASPEKVNKLIAEASKAADARSASSGSGTSIKDMKALDAKAKEANKKADAAEKAWRKAGAKPGAQQKEVRRLDKEAKAADKAADKAAKGLAKMRSQDEKLKAASAKVNQQLKTAKGDRAKALRGKRADIEEARNKLRYAMKGLGGGQSKLTGADVKRAVGTAD